MDFKVRMLAFHGRLMEGLTVVIRTVTVPTDKLTGHTDQDLNLIYQYGQNDFQPIQGICSVSIGDVIEHNGKLHAVISAGFKEITPEQYNELKHFDRSSLSFHPILTDNPNPNPKMSTAMYEKGYRILMESQEGTVMPLHVKTSKDVADVMREYPDHRFNLYNVNEDGTVEAFKGNQPVGQL